MNFDLASEKEVMADALCIEIVERESNYFLNGAEPFTRRNNRLMILDGLQNNWERKRIVNQS